MKIIIFAGGHGLRMWPISRKNSPKQFEKMFEGKSTLQLMVERVEKVYGLENIYISTNSSYKEIIEEQLPKLPHENVIYEPVKRDLAAAVGLSFMKLKTLKINEPVAILWSDHLIADTSEFEKALKIGEELIMNDPNRFVFTGETPRFANNNIGWIEIGEERIKGKGLQVFDFSGWSYRPALNLCNEMFKSGKALWNTGYFISSLDFVIGLYQEHMPAMYSHLKKIAQDPTLIEELYPLLESISFDDAIVVKTKENQAVVIKTDMGWSDPGSLYALKEALVSNTSDNFVKGRAVAFECKDSMIYNQNDGQLVATIGLDGFIVVNTGDTLLVCHKDRVSDIKALLLEMEKEGYEELL
jgi:mannose-1-phosphate guanylyltransferase